MTWNDMAGGVNSEHRGDGRRQINKGEGKRDLWFFGGAWR